MTNTTGARAAMTALAEMVAAFEARYPAREEGDAAQQAWAHRQSAALEAARALLASSQAAQPDELEEMRERKDAAYLERNQVVAALAKCFPSGVARTAIEGWSEDWHGCVYIDLPTGQASWHFHDSHAYLFDGLPRYEGAWDGHDTPEKYRRVAALQSIRSSSEAALAQVLDALRIGRVASEWAGNRQDIVKCVVAMGAARALAAAAQTKEK